MTALVTAPAPTIAPAAARPRSGLGAWWRDTVVFTDYPGLGTPGPHPYLVGESEGRAVLDSIRATRQLLGGAVSDTAAGPLKR